MKKRAKRRQTYRRRDTGGGLYRREILTKLRTINKKQGELIDDMLHTPQFISLIDYKRA